MDKLFSLEDVLSELESPDSAFEGKILRQLADTMRQNERLRHAISMLSSDDLSPKQRSRIVQDLPK